ncbi:hypothetical protein E2C01_082414 [Portunus trituberculatus]|uniref:Uncharacterized protein n=1 Tax=Portunus trituberculatus TaxID=210409 RepID=A0A5B7IZ20_PORTR|nr:hypothetical protein [Portunus trituberculatus]
MEFEAFLYTTTTAVTPHHRFAAQEAAAPLPTSSPHANPANVANVAIVAVIALEYVLACSPTKACCENCGRDATALAVRVSGAVDGCPCPLVVDTGAAKTFVREEVMAVQTLPMSDRQLCGVTGHCTMLRGPVMDLGLSGAGTLRRGLSRTERREGAVSVCGLNGAGTLRRGLSVTDFSYSVESVLRSDRTGSPMIKRRQGLTAVNRK